MGPFSAFAAAAGLGAAMVSGCRAPPAVAPMTAPSPALGSGPGPILGHVSPRSAAIWARCADLDRPRLVHLAVEAATAASGDGDAASTRGVHWLAAEADPARDGCVVWRLEGLEPSTSYRYRVEPAPRGSLGESGWTTFRTAPPPDEPARVTIAFGSCATAGPEMSRTWQRLQEIAPDALVLLGDTPYIDTTDLHTQRRRYREFFGHPDLARLGARTPIYAVWDDHDMGGNDVDGRIPGKERARQAFIEYHANPSWGDERGGVYTSVRRGPIEVFLIDARYFANTEPSPVDPERSTLLGRTQWEWLRAGLAGSTAPFKVLASGMIWNGAVRFRKADHWESWRHERDALFALIGNLQIGGVVLVAGDVHRSRVIRHAVSDVAGEDLLEFITSPLHDRVMAASAAPHPGLIADFAEPHTFLLMTADTTVAPPRLELRMENAAGEVLFETTITGGE
jgi:alkaline phosphatase D